MSIFAKNVFSDIHISKKLAEKLFNELKKYNLELNI